jgi:hypothetical protein
MKTDFKKLTAFEGALVSMIVLGIAIIGFEIYTSLPARTQVAFADAVQVFDMHEPVVQQVKLLNEVSLSMLRVYDQFNMAFMQTMALGDELNSFSDLYESSYEKVAAITSISIAQLGSRPAIASAKGMILGAVTTVQEQYSNISATSVQETETGCGMPNQVSAAASEPEPAYEAFYFSDFKIPKTVSYFIPLLKQN